MLVRALALSKRLAVEGELAAVSVSVRPPGVRCSLAARYADRSEERSLTSTKAEGGRASWNWRVPENIAAGAARATVSCGRAGAVSQRLVIVGSLTAPRITVDKQGFSVRSRRFIGSSVSYGLILRNQSSSQDALNVSVLVNFVMADDRLIGSASTTVPAVAAGSTYALGNSLTFPGAAPVARLEVVVQVGSHKPRSLRFLATANIRMEPGVFDTAWVGGIDGELINDSLSVTLERASLSAVVFDAAGNVIGGGTGFALSSLPPGARLFFKVTLGVDAIPFERAASAVISVDPSWRQPGS